MFNTIDVTISAIARFKIVLTQIVYSTVIESRKKLYSINVLDHSVRTV